MAGVRRVLGALGAIGEFRVFGGFVASGAHKRGYSVTLEPLGRVASPSRTQSITNFLSKHHSALSTGWKRPGLRRDSC